MPRTHRNIEKKRSITRLDYAGGRGFRAIFIGRTHRIESLQSADNNLGNINSRRSSLGNRHVSPVNTVRNFDLSYVTNRISTRWPDTSHMNQNDLK